MDVIPFVPLRDISLAECAALARDFGRRVGAELDIPVYLYEAAALRPERVNLADVRRGGYEALKDRHPHAGARARFRSGAASARRARSPSARAAR